MIIEKKITELCVGHYVVDISKQTGKFSLTAPAHIKSEIVIERLIAKGVESVMIDTSKTIEPTISPEITPLEQARKQFAKELGEAKQLFNEAKVISQKVFDDAKSGCPLDLSPVIEITNKSVDTIFNNPDSLACVINIRQKDAYLLEHSVSVSVLMTIFARYLNIEKTIVQELSIGAFLHDVGKIMIPDNILNKPGKLTDDEFYIMKTHANHSIEIISRTPGISDLSLEIAAQHHEKLDGKGYPYQLNADKITRFGRMISICDIFDALTATRVYKEGYAHVKAFTILRNLAQENHLDAELVDHFIKCIGVYPVGSLVELSSNRIAIVECRNNDDPIRPKVRSFYSVANKDYVETQDIDLTAEEDFIIKGVKASDFDLDMNKVIEFLLMQG